MWVCLNGKFVKEENAKVSVFDNGFLYGDGVYDTLRTYGGKVFGIEKHVERLERSAKRMKIRLPFKKKEIGEMVLKLVDKNEFKESRIRITVTRGTGSKGFSECKNPTLLIHAVPLKPEPKSVYENGVDVITVRLERMAPEAKTTSLLPMILAHQEIDRLGVFEALYVDCRDFVSEGTITNLFMIKNGVVIIPKSNVLEGTTRSIILDLARGHGLKVVERDIKRRALYEADEVFITNAPRKIIPVKKIDGIKIGNGKPGVITKQLMKSFDGYVKENIGR